MKGFSLHTTFRNLLFAAIAMSLLISGIAQPLLVRCTPGDGSSTLELIGRDPHHHVHSGYFCEFSKNASGDSFSFCAGGCVDLFLNHTAILRNGPHHPLPKSIWGAFAILPSLPDSCEFPLSDLGRAPATHTSFHSPFKQPLRI